MHVARVVSSWRCRFLEALKTSEPPAHILRTNGAPGDCKGSVPSGSKLAAGNLRGEVDLDGGLEVGVRGLNACKLSSRAKGRSRSVLEKCGWIA